MISLLKIYQWTILAGMITAAALAQLGAHLAARGRSSQTLCLSQGASLGVLIGMLVVCEFVSPEAVSTSTWPLVSGLVMAAITFALCEWTGRGRGVKNPAFIALFVVIWALSPLISGLFPRIDDHLTQVYFGDLVTLSDRNILVSSVFGALGLAILSVLWRPYSAGSFEAALTGQERLRQQPRWIGLSFHAIALVLICFCVQFLGLVFTLSSLFVPTVLLAGASISGLRRHLILSSLAAALGACAGFLLSLTYAKLSTVPTIVVSQVVFSVLILLPFWARRRIARP